MIDRREELEQKKMSKSEAPTEKILNAPMSSVKNQKCLNKYIFSIIASRIQRAYEMMKKRERGEMIQKRREIQINTIFVFSLWTNERATKTRIKLSS